MFTAGRWRVPAMPFMRVSVAGVDSWPCCSMLDVFGVSGMSIGLGCSCHHTFGENTTTVVMCLLWYVCYSRRDYRLLGVIVLMMAVCILHLTRCRSLSSRSLWRMSIMVMLCMIVLV
jgi:hypothetical protein